MRGRLDGDGAFELSPRRGIERLAGEASRGLWGRRPVAPLGKNYRRNTTSLLKKDL